MKAIMYHYVRPAPEGLPFFRYLHVDDFARQLDWFAARHGFVTRDAFLAARERGEAPSGVILTFDDGLSDHYEHVLPLLVERRLFGFFYVCTGPYRTGKLLDVHRIHMLLGRLGGQAALARLAQHVRPEMLGHDHVHEFHQATYRNQDNDQATTLFKRTLNYLISYEHRELVLDALLREELDEAHLVNSFYMSHDQIRAMDAAGMAIGSHGVHHYVCSKLSVGEQRSEITASFADLSAILGKPVDSFCYPYGGRHTFTSDTMALLSEAGSAFSFDVNPRDITAEDFLAAPQALPRYDCNMFPHGKASSGDQRAQQAA